MDEIGRGLGARRVQPSLARERNLYHRAITPRQGTDIKGWFRHLWYLVGTVLVYVGNPSVLVVQTSKGRMGRGRPKRWTIRVTAPADWLERVSPHGPVVPVGGGKDGLLLDVDVAAGHCWILHRPHAARNDWIVLREGWPLTGSEKKDR